MPTPAVTVVRYSALVFGVLYGFTHRQTLQAKFDANAAQHEIEKRQEWLQKAKDAWAAKNAKEDGLITDPENPAFDLEAVLKSFEK
ncbi:F1F0 ATP synthase subunit e, mitochondrial [Microbotryomycetes sp. JL221]|nr:F1F0 ATP synthase subunit e, mitochondrial [Microbotryomycetes sp. JL221]